MHLSYKPMPGQSASSLKDKYNDLRAEYAALQKKDHSDLSEKAKDVQVSQKIREVGTAIRQSHAAAVQRESFERQAIAAEVEYKLRDRVRVYAHDERIRLTEEAKMKRVVENAINDANLEASRKNADLVAKNARRSALEAALQSETERIQAVEAEERQAIAIAKLEAEQNLLKAKQAMSGLTTSSKITASALVGGSSTSTSVNAIQKLMDAQDKKDGADVKKVVEKAKIKANDAKEDSKPAA